MEYSTASIVFKIAIHHIRTPERFDVYPRVGSLEELSKVCTIASSGLGCRQQDGT